MDVMTLSFPTERRWLVDAPSGCGAADEPAVACALSKGLCFRPFRIRSAARGGRRNACRAFHRDDPYRKLRTTMSGVTGGRRARQCSMETVPRTAERGRGDVGRGRLGQPAVPTLRAVDQDAGVVRLSHDEALVLVEWLSRIDELANDFGDLVEDHAEQRALWNLTCFLERVLVEPIRRVSGTG